MRTAKTPRRGLTLIELLVAAALSLVIMAILASAFATGTDTLRQLKSAGDMQRALRAAAEKIKADLAAPHFDDPNVAGGKLSNVRFDLNRTSYPTSGVVRIVQRGSAYQEFLQDPNANQYFPTTVREYSTVASPTPKTSARISPTLNQVSTYVARPNGNSHALQMAVKLDGKTRQTVFTAPRPATVPGSALDNKYDNLVPNSGSYATRWAVVNYFLADSGTRTVNGSPLFNLHRRVQLLAEVPGAVIPGLNANFSIRPTAVAGQFAVNTVADLTRVANRPAAFAPTGDGSDIVLTNVISFEVKANWDGGFRKLTATPSQPYDLPNFDFPFDDFPPINQATFPGSSLYDDVPRIFDTTRDLGSTEPLVGVPLTPVTGHTRVRVNAIQVKLRVWDPNQHTSRQVTLVQDM